MSTPDMVRIAPALLLTLATALAPAAPLGAQSDDCPDAPLLEVGPFAGSTLDATNDGRSFCGRSSLSPDIWFRHVAASEAILVVETCGSDYDTVVSLHSACPGAGLQELACNDDACSLQSRAATRVEPGQQVWIRITGFDEATGNVVGMLSYLDIPKGDGPDVVVRGIEDLMQVGRAGTTVAVACESLLCNTGSEALEWFQNPNPNHPFLVFNVHRLRGGRLEQIGQSWVKHGFYSSQEELCSLPCLPQGEGVYLGIGCADVYSVGTNAEQESTGPRDEIDPWTGAFSFEGSFIDLHKGQAFGSTEIRLQVDDADLDPALNPGAEYFMELYVLAHDDVNHENSVGWRRFGVTGLVSLTWQLELSGSVESGMVLSAWEGATIESVPEIPVRDRESFGDGRVYVASRATEAGEGRWRYEYALYNLDMQRGVRSFAVRAPATIQVSDIDFHAVRSHDEPRSNEPWVAVRVDDMVTWSTEDFETDPLANALRWGTMYTFWFEADAPPGEVAATITPFRPGEEGEPDELGVTVSGPVPPLPRFRRGDADVTGAVDLVDAIFTLNFLFLGGPAPSCLDAADANDTGGLDLTDPVHVLNWLFRGMGEPLPPGPFTCGEDPTPSEPGAFDCAYDESTCAP